MQSPGQHRTTSSVGRQSHCKNCWKWAPFFAEKTSIPVTKRPHTDTPGYSELAYDPGQKHASTRPGAQPLRTSGRPLQALCAPAAASAARS